MKKNKIVRKIPHDALAPKDAAVKYGLSWSGVRVAINRKKIRPIRYGSRWYVTDREMKKYFRTRNALKVPKKYRRSL